MNIRFLASILFAASILPSCAADDGKGDEDNALDIYESKTDSFRNPTEHGDLLFGVPQFASLQEDAGFHAWDFDLTDDAKVNLETILKTANLDTVMYLYKFDETRGRYGAYKYKNDDANPETVASALSKNLDAGSYRVLVKGFKSKLRGDFEIAAECDGAGCSKSTCDATSLAGLDADVSDSCGELFSAALSGKSLGRTSTTIALADRCSLPPNVAAAAEEYVNYWDGIGFDLEFEGPDAVELNISWESYDNGALYVGIDFGGDEDGMDYLINRDGQVIAHYQHNQSPDHTLYCDGLEEFLEDGECFFEYTANFPHDPSDERSVDATVTLDDVDSLGERTAELAVQAYAAELGLSDDDDISVDGQVWDLGGSDSAGRITVKTSGEDAFVYELEAQSNTQLQFTVKRGNDDAEYTCAEF
tara:strand:+ start:125287 stop:126540 length:1254 start_codon:yes stop_codon:yes gene_type:complete